MPPLRERRDDIPILVQHFMKRFARGMNRQVATVPDETMRALMQWTWPGNIREVENLVERAVILSPGRTLLLPPGLRQEQPLLPRGPPSPAAGSPTLRGAEREAILQALRASNGVAAGPDGAAGRLGLKRTTLQRRWASSEIPGRPTERGDRRGGARG